MVCQKSGHFSSLLCPYCIKFQYNLTFRLTTCLLFLSSSINPFLYAFYGQRLRKNIMNRIILVINRPVTNDQRIRPQRNSRVENSNFGTLYTAEVISWSFDFICFYTLMQLYTEKVYWNDKNLRNHVRNDFLCILSLNFVTLVNGPVALNVSLESKTG